MYPPTTLYILECASPGKYYVGSTYRSKKKRFLEHLESETGGCKWTERYGAKRIIKSFPIPNEESTDIENSVTEFYCRKYGFENVRGGDFTYAQLDPDGVCRIPEWVFFNLEAQGYMIRDPL